jgi:DNA replication ATP-dependent helicase Dna2
LPNSFALLTGSIKALARDEVSVKCDRKLPLAYRNSSLLVKFRIDPYQVGTTNFSTLRSNLINLVSAHKSLAVSKIKDIIIGNRLPTFTETIPDVTTHISFVGLNKGQKDACEKVLSANDFTLLFGMPGCGKTSAIVSLISILTTLGKSVLVSSYTNTALDHILGKLVEEHVEFIRLGSPSRVF